MRTRLRHDDESGIALVSALLVLLLMSSLMVGFMAMATADTRTRAISGARTQAFYAAHAGLEQLTADLGDLFSANFAASCEDINALVADPPDLAGVTWAEPDGGSGYRIDYDCSDDVPVAETRNIASGPFQGFVGLATEFTMSVTAHQLDGSEASLERSLQTVAIPVFQFGMFSETDLSFFAGPEFNFGGRVHTNGNLFLAADPGPLIMSDRVTAVGEVVRAELSNNLSTASSHSGDVRILKSTGSFRDLERDEGSVVSDVDSAPNEPKWTNLSTGTYNSNIINGRTGARRLELPLTSFGAEPIDLIRRPVVNEDATAPNVLSQRFYSMASLRILLSDTQNEILNLPGVTPTPPVSLASLAGTGITPSAATPNFAVAQAPTSTNGVRVASGQPLLTGFLKIERQNDDATWTDVTLEILSYGYSGRPWPALDSDGDVITSTVCGASNEPSPNAIIRLQRRRDGISCTSTTSTGTDHWPNVLYDPREALLRDGHPDDSPLKYGGVMHYVELDVENLSDWFDDTLGGTGDQAIDVTGYVVYFSDRRGNKNAVNVETGEYGFEDFVNRATGGGWTAGGPNSSLEKGEDLNGNGALDVYGITPRIPAGLTMAVPMNDGNIRPWTNIDENGGSDDGDLDIEETLIGRINPPVFFRRALKLTNGSLGNIVAPGLTIASENPVYIQGNWNANGGFGNPHVATAVLADAVTLLSNNFNDRRSFEFAQNVSAREATTTWYRVAIIAGKGLSFQGISGTTNADYGTDGGAHNFLRYIENWSGQTLNYRGAIASMFISRQAVGTYKCCADVYQAPTRAFAFDTDFLIPALLPPRTPMFRDVNTTGFAQIIRPK